MPKLLVADPAQPAQLPTATPAAFGAGVGQAMDATGRVAQALGQVVNEYVETEARASAVRYSQELEAVSRTLSLDPDIPGRMEKFEAERQRLFDQYRPKWGGGATYDARAGLATTDLQGRFAHATMLDAIKQSQANNALEREHWASKAANADTEEEALSYLAQAKESLEAGSLYLSSAEKTVAEQETLAQTIGLATKTNPELADALMNRFGQALPPKVQTELRGNISTEAKYIEAQRVSDLALDTLGPDASVTELTRFVRQHSEGAVRSEAESRVRVAAQDREAAKIDRERNLSDGIWDQINAGAGLEVIPRGLPQHLEGPMRNYIAERSKAQAAGEAFDPKTVPSTYIDLLTQAEKDPAAFSKVPLPMYRLQLNDKHYGQLERQQKAIRTGQASGESASDAAAQKSPSGASPLEIAHQVAIEAGLKTTEEFAPYKLRAIEAIEAAQAKKGAPLTFKEEREIATGQLRSVTLRDAGWFWKDKNKRVADLTADDRKTLEQDPPADLIDHLRKEFANRGITDLTDEELIGEVGPYLDFLDVPKGAVDE